MVRTPCWPYSWAVANAINETYNTPKELAERAKLHESTIRKMFMDEPGVVRIGHAARGRKQQYFTLRIPESVVQRVFGRMTVSPDTPRRPAA